MEVYQVKIDNLENEVKLFRNLASKETEISSLKQNNKIDQEYEEIIKSRKLKEVKI